MDLQKGRIFTDIQKEIEVSKHQSTKFIANTELAELYSAMEEYWNLDKPGRSVFKASIFYNLGRVHGKRAERAKRKAREAS